jgi:hypothetical protein
MMQYMPVAKMLSYMKMVNSLMLFLMKILVYMNYLQIFSINWSEDYSMERTG